MSRQHHELKTESSYFQCVEVGIKKFELRKNDRNFKQYDIVILKEVVQGVPTGRSLGPFEIKYVLEGGKFGLPQDHCIFNW
jgi:ParB family transcriptional regulator, chromosome partitioning protein